MLDEVGCILLPCWKAFSISAQPCPSTSETMVFSRGVFSHTVSSLEKRQVSRETDRRNFRRCSTAPPKLYVEMRDHPRRGAGGAADATTTNMDEGRRGGGGRRGARRSEAATLAVQEGVRMHGSMGMTNQYDIGFFMKRARIYQDMFSNSNLPRRPSSARMKNNRGFHKKKKKKKKI